MFVDSHCHLNFADFGGDLDLVVERAHAAGVRHLLTICTHLEEAKDVRNVADSYPQIFHTVGIHPHESTNYDQFSQEELIDKLTTFCEHPKAIGLGETGLDYYYALSPKETQQRVFETHIQAGLKLELPLVIHTREADEDTIRFLAPHKGNIRGVLHSFSGSWELASRALDLGLYISFSGILTFKTADTLRDLAKKVPLDRMLIETDSPYLAPVPMRGKRNEPSFVTHTAALLAQIRNIPLETLGEHTTNNFFKLFSKASPLSVMS